VTSPHAHHCCCHHAPAIIIKLDSDGFVEHLNEQAQVMFGWLLDESQPLTWVRQCVHESDRPALESTIRQALSDPHFAGQLQLRMVTGDDQIIPMSVIIEVQQDITGRTGIVLAAMPLGQPDLHDDHAEALRESESRLRAVVETAVDGIITIDERGVIDSFNSAAEIVFGYEPEEVIGRNISMLMPEPHSSIHDRYINNYIRTGHRRIIGIGREVVGRRKDGSLFPMDLAVSEIRLGERRLFTGIIRDLTERKRLEYEIAQVSTEEQQRIGRDLHDGLGQELTGIAFLTQVLQEQLESRGLEEAKNAAKIVSLANQAIDHTRALVKGLCPVKLHADGLIFALQEMADNTADVHRIECIFECEEPVLISDTTVATQLYYIAYEAVNNALKHSGGNQIVIKLIPEGDLARLSVEDNGKGLDPQMERPLGRGLATMSYRARIIGSELIVRPALRCGTMVSCTFNPRGNVPHASEVMS
jgi:PAS domain S-box-containing protein